MQRQPGAECLSAVELTKNQTLVFAGADSAPAARSAPTRCSTSCATTVFARRCRSIGRWKSCWNGAWCTGWKASTPSSPARIRHDHAHGLIAFAICEECGQVTEFSDEMVEKRLNGWAGKSRLPCRQDDDRDPGRLRQLRLTAACRSWNRRRRCTQRPSRRGPHGFAARRQAQFKFRSIWTKTSSP